MTRANVEAARPLSPVQEGLLAHSVYAPAHDPYFGQLCLELRGPFDGDALHGAWRRLVERHEALRSAFLWETVDRPLQVVRRRVELPWRSEDWSDLPAGALDARLREALEADRRLGFRLDRAPLLRLALYRAAPDRHLLVCSSHHLLVDGWSRAVLLGELFTVYQALAAGAEPELPPVPPAADYLAWSERLDEGADEAFWRRELAGPDGAGALPLTPGSTAGPAEERDDAERALALDPEVAAALPGWLRRRRLTVPTLVQGLWALALGAISGRDRVVFGQAVSGRPPELPGIERAVGMFVNVVPVRVAIPARGGVGDWLADLQRRSLARQAHSYAPLARILEWSGAPRGVAPFESLLATGAAVPAVGGGAAAPAAGAGDGRLEVVERSSRDGSVYPLTLTARGGGGFELRLTYDRRRCSEATAEALLGLVGALAEGIADDPERPPAKLPLMTPALRRRVVVEWNRTAADHAGAPTLHGLFEEQVARTPDAVAISCAGRQVSYRELDRRADRLARQLGRLGVGPESRVGVAAERSVGLAVALLATLKAGAAYVPLEPDSPPERLRFVRGDFAAAGERPVVLVQDGLEAALAAAGDARVVPIGWAARGGAERDGDEPDGDEPDGAQRAAPRVATLPDQAAYVLYTSGSTGRPKGAIVSHRAIRNRILWMREAFAVGPDDRVLHKTPYGFDVSVWELFLPLAAGATLVVAAPGGHRDPGYLRRTIAAEGVTTVHFIPSMLGELLAEPALERLTSLRRVIASGEALAPDLVRRFGRRLGAAGARLHNLYGPTEAAVDVTWWPCPAGGDPGPVAIGRPVANTRIHLLDRGLRPVPPGVPGELYIGGVQVARGYHGRPALTAQSFVPDPLAGEPGLEAPAGGRLYRTGDLARHLPDGEVEFLGRRDHQVKVRGVRIEPGEIEAALRAHPEVAEAVVTAVDGAGAGVRLVAYVVAGPGGAPAAAGLRRFVAGGLPEAMIPAAFVVLDRLPRTVSGKIDRKALPAPAPESETPARTGARPRTATEATVAEIFVEVLGVPAAEAGGDFFALGGHSLLAMRLAARVRAVFDVELPVAAVLAEPTVAVLARRIDAAGAGTEGAPTADAGPIPPAPATDEAPLSPGQERLWLLAQLDPLGAAYNIAGAVHLRGALDRPALGAAVGALVDRHDALRTRFPLRDGRPRAVVEPAGAAPPLPTVDLSALPPAVRERELEALGTAAARRPFDLARDRLFRALAVRSAAELHSLLITLHHVVGDGWSLEVLLGDLAALYRAAAHGEAPPPAPPITFAAWAAWQRRRLAAEEVGGRQVAYWRRRLVPPPPLLDLPFDRPRPERPSSRGGRCAFALPPETTAALRREGRRRGATPFMILTAAVTALLARYSGSDDVAVGTPVANRGRPELDGLVGFIANMVVVRTRLAGDPSLGALLAAVKEAALGAYAHADVPFEELVHRLRPPRVPGANPLFQVAVVLQQGELPGFELPGLAVEPADLPDGTSKFDLTLSFTDRGDDFAATAIYASALFDRTTVERMAGHLRALTAAAVADPGRPLSQLPLLAAAERHQLLVEPVAPGRASVPADTLHRRIAERVRERPDAVAVVDGDRALSYGELWRRADRLARRLRARGVGPEDRVGVCAERSAELVVALLGVLAAGAAYVPLDPRYPERRLSFLAADSRLAAVVAGDGLAGRLAAATEAPVEPLDARPGDHDSLDDQSLDDQSLDAGALDAGALDDGARAANLAYVIYTSGSTGRPKGVEVSHANVLRLFDVSVDELDLGPDDVWSLFHSFAFDFSVWEIFGALLLGARLEVVPWPVSRDPAAFLRLLAERRVTVLSQTPSAFRSLTAVEESRPLPAAGALRRVVFGGEALDLPAVEPWWRRHGDRRPELVNMYGITETTVHVTLRRLRRDAPGRAAGAPIGPPLADLTLLLLDRRGQPVPAGVVGEIHVGGAGLARGYLGRPGLTAERFVPDPFGAPGGRLYRSGDLGVVTARGELYPCGRADHQVKIRGFRVEPGEVAAAVEELPGVGRSVAVCRPGADGEPRLIAYWTASPDGEGGAGTGMREALARRLPEHMVPSALVEIDELPLTAHGKIDRAALPEPPAPRPEPDRAAAPPRSSVEEMVCALWARLLGVDRVGAGDDFFALGGSSLSAVTAAEEAARLFGVGVPLPRFFADPTPAGVAACVEEGLRGDRDGAPLHPRPADARSAGGGGPAPLSSAQRRIWVHSQIHPDSGFYNVLSALRLRGALDVPALDAALDALPRRHPALRTAIRVVEGEPLQEMTPHRRRRLPLADLSALPAAPRAAAARRAVAALAAPPFDLGSGRLLRSLAVRLDRGEHLLAVATHHVACDGWSVGLLARDLARLYGAARRGAPVPAPGSGITAADFARWQHEATSPAAVERLLAYWRRALEGAPRRLGLATDRPRRSGRPPRGARVPVALPAPVASALPALAAGRGVTLFMVVWAAFLVFLRHWTGGRDLVVGSNVANRHHPGCAELVGCLINQIVLRADLGGARSFGDVLDRVRSAALGAYAHQELPLETLVQALGGATDPARPFPFEVKVELQPELGTEVRLEGLEVEDLEPDRVVVRHDLHLLVAERAGGLEAWLLYDADLFAEHTAALMAAQLEALFAAVAERPDAALEELLESLESIAEERGRARRRERRESNLEVLRRLAGASPAVAAGHRQPSPTE